VGEKPFETCRIGGRAPQGAANGTAQERAKLKTRTPPGSSCPARMKRKKRNKWRKTASQANRISFCAQWEVAAPGPRALAAGGLAHVPAL